MSVSPELLDIRDLNKMGAEAALRAAEHADSQLEAEAALLQVQTFIMNAELDREQATETILQIFRVVNGYVVKTESEPETMGDEAINEHADSQLEARTALYKVKKLISIAELAREEATELIRRIFQVVNDYVVKMESKLRQSVMRPWMRMNRLEYAAAAGAAHRSLSLGKFIVH